MDTAISSRGMQALAPRRPDIMYLFQKSAETAQAALSDQYNPTKNPNGYLTMLIAGNKLMQKELKEKL